MKLPKTYRELMAGPHEDWVSEVVYFLELEHGLMGQFPALIKGDGNPRNWRMVITLDRGLLVKVQALLSPRRCKVTQINFSVNHSMKIGYEVSESGSGTSHRLFDQCEFDALIAADPKPFLWAPGRIGEDMTMEEFRETLQFAAVEAGVTLPV